VDPDLIRIHFYSWTLAEGNPKGIRIENHFITVIKNAEYERFKKYKIYRYCVFLLMSDPELL
jgi:hypothetical protein